MRRNLRGTRWVDSRIQGALIGRTLIHWVFFVIATLAATSGLEHISAVLAGQPEDAPALSLSKFWERCQPLSIVMFLFLPIFCLDLVIWSHRFVGPMVKIRRAAHDLATGKSITPIRLRQGDYWADLADDINDIQQRIDCAQKRQNAEQFPSQEQDIQASVASLEEILASVPKLTNSSTPTGD